MSTTSGLRSLNSAGKRVILSSISVLTHFLDPDRTEEIFLSLPRQTCRELTAFFFIIHFCWIFPQECLNLLLCKTESDCVMPKVSSSCEHKNPLEETFVEHWHTPECANTKVWCHLQCRTFTVNSFYQTTWKSEPLCYCEGKNVILSKS